MMADEAPLPGRATVQVRFFSLLHCTGRSFSELTPRPSGPRQHGQSAAGRLASSAWNRQKVVSQFSGDAARGAQVGLLLMFMAGRLWRG